VGQVIAAHNRYAAAATGDNFLAPKISYWMVLP
jgi:hypothetical protein